MTRLLQARILKLEDDVRALTTALRDAISTYGDKDEIVVTAERQEAWQAVLDRHGVVERKDSP